jgi:hypothetical protein
MGGVAALSRSVKEKKIVLLPKDVFKPVNNKRERVEKKVGDGGVDRL